MSAIKTAIIGAFAACLLLASSSSRADTPPTGAGALRVIVEDQAAADGRGVFGVVTGDGHPLGTGADILATRDGGTDAYSSYLSVRSYTTGTDYVQTSAPPVSANTLVPLDAYASVLPIADGYRAFYDIPASAPGGESLAITFDATAAGSGPASRVVLSVTVTNRNVFPVAVGLRYLFDITDDGDDGPPISGAGDSHTTESGIAPVPAGFSVGSASEGSTTVGSPAGPAPDAAVLAHWNRAFESAFDFAPDGSDVTSPGSLDDSALLVYFGRTEARAIVIPPDESATATLAIGLQAAEDCQNGSDDDLDGLADAADPDCATPAATASPPASKAPSGTAASSPTAAVTPTTGPGALPSAGGFLGLGGSGVAAVIVGGGILLAAAVGALILARRQARA